MKSEGRVAIILAGDEGKELRSLTPKIADPDVPKQFCQVVGESSLLEQTFKRVALAYPAERIVTVVTRAHERFYESLLPDVLPPRLVVFAKSRNCTGDALCVTAVPEHRRNGAVAIFPAHNYVEDDAAFMRYQIWRSKTH